MKSFPCVLAKNDGSAGFGSKDYLIGEEALKRKDTLELKYPIENGLVSNWDHWEKIIHYAFYEVLKVAPEEHPVLISEPALNPKPNREKITQIMFETFNVPSFFLLSDGVLALKAVKRTTGIVL